jgi:pimeloyl-ACP methyl ester carboxylesterase
LKKAWMSMVVLFMAAMAGKAQTGRISGMVEDGSQKPPEDIYGKSDQFNFRNTEAEFRNARDTRVGNLSFIYRYGKPENPTVLCIHGLTRNASDFHFLAEALANKYHLICLDMPGRGASPCLSKPKLYNNAFYASLVAQWLESAGGSPVHYIGTSMGGMIGMILAATKPALMRSLILNDVGALVPASEIARLKTYVGVDTGAPDYEALAVRVARNLEQFGIQDASVREHFIRNSIEPDGAGGVRMRYDPAIRHALLELGDKDVSLNLLWKAIKCPTLVIRGDKSELLPEKVALHMLQVNKKSALFTVEGAGHAPSLTTPNEIECIDCWLSQLDNNNT